MFWLYDEVPTASSVAIHFNDDDDPDPSVGWPYLPEITLAAGTYYLLVHPWEGADWITFEGGYVGVRVRWEQAPHHRGLLGRCGHLQDHQEPPDWIYIQPTLVDSVAATVDDATDVHHHPWDGGRGRHLPGSRQRRFRGVAPDVTIALMAGRCIADQPDRLATTPSPPTTTSSRAMVQMDTGSVTRSGSSSTNSTAKAAVLTIWRNAGTPVHTVGATIACSSS